jgi:mannose-6-phosphate isomerase
MMVDKFLNFIPVKRGDFFYIPAGSIHAIGKNVTLCEVQQNSGITYRVWDWNRLGLDGKPRDLHIDRAKDVTRFDDDFNEKLLDSLKRNLLDQIGISTVVDHKDLNVQLFSNLTQKELELN